MNKKNNTNLLTPYQIAQKVDFGLVSNTQNKLDMQENLLVNFGRAFKSKFQDSYHLFNNVYFFDYDILDIDPNSLIERSARTLGYQKNFLIIVYPESGEIKTETISSESFPYCEMIIIHTSFEDLFKTGLFSKIYLETENSTLAFRTIFNFRGWNYSGLQAMFRIQNIILSGGKTQTRHVLNPLTHRFSQFISVFESFNLNGVINSYHNCAPLSIKSGSFIKAALGPKNYKSTQAVGDLSTKAFDLRWRAIFKEFFNKDLPIREKKGLVSAKRIDTNVSANTQNNDAVTENTHFSQININLQKGKKDFDFKNDPWIDNELKSTLYKMSPEYKEQVDTAMKLKVQKMKADLAISRARELKEREEHIRKLELKKERENDYWKSKESFNSLKNAYEELKEKLNNKVSKYNKKIENYLLKLVKHLILLDKTSSNNKKSDKQILSEITNSEINTKKVELLKASNENRLLNRVFSKIFKAHFYKPFGSFKRITKDNVLEFKKLLINEHPLLIQAAKKDTITSKTETIKRIQQTKARQVAQDELDRITLFRFAHPELAVKDVPSHMVPNPLSLELAFRKREEENKAREAERIRLASILTKDQLKAKRIEEIKELLDTSTVKPVYIPDAERDELQRELKLLTKSRRISSDLGSQNNSDKRTYSTMAFSRTNKSKSLNLNQLSLNKLFKRDYHKSYLSLNKGKKDFLDLLRENDLTKEVTENNIAKNSLISIEDKNQHIKLFSFLDYVSVVLNDNSLTTYEKQTKIETEWMENIKIKLSDPEFSKTRLSIHINRAFNILKIQFGSKKSSKSLAELPDDWNTFLIRIENLILAFGYIITYCSRMNYTYIASLIGNALFWEYYRFYIKKQGKEYYEGNGDIKYFKNYDLFYSYNKFNEEQAVRLGDNLIECFIRIEIIERRFDLEDKGKAYLEIRQECINEIVENTFIIPTSLPMCHKPNEWSEDKRGGFLSNLKGKGEDLIQGSALRENHLIENRQELFDSINTLDSIKFQINKDFLNYIINDGYFLLSSEEEKNWIQNLISIKIAQTYLNTTFYINTFADWRGRIYTNSFFISYQGSNLAKNLLYFQKGEVLNERGFDYLYIYGANAYDENGLSKKSINDRINWVQKNYQNILKMDKDFLLNAKEKFTFAAFCLTIRKLHNNHKTIIHLPIFLDATCSGIQHLAALMKDLDSASRVNLIEQQNDEPVADIYTDVVVSVNEALNKFGLENMQTHFHFTKIQLTRKEIKRLVMTKPYNASIFGMTQALANSFEITEKAKELLKQKLYFRNNKNSGFDETQGNKALVKTEEESYNPYIYIAPGFGNDKVLLSKKDLYLIAKIVDDQVFMMFPALKEIYNYLLDISKLLRDLKIPITWFTPAGVKITQHYLKNESHNYYMRTGNTRKTIILRNKMKDVNSNEYVVDRRKQVESIIPNVIHSLDACHLMFVIKECFNSNISPVITVHDCFGTLPNQMFNLEQVVKKQFIHLYTKENFLQKFHKKLLESIEDNNYVVFKKGERKGRKDKIIELLRTFDNANIKRNSSIATKSTNSTKSNKSNNKKAISKEQQILNISNKITKSFKNSNALVVSVDELKSSFPNSTSTKFESAYSFLEVPTLPKLGKLDLNKIIYSKYMIT